MALFKGKEDALVGILVFFHCESNPGYAAASHEITFLEMARRLVGNLDNVHFSYPTTANGLSPGIPNDLTNIIEFDASSQSPQELSKIEAYVRRHNIQIAFGFDQPVRRLAHKYLRRGGVRHIIAYWGAPMSSANSGLKLAFKRIDFALSRQRPDHFIFQSKGMRESAVCGRGIPRECTSVVRTGIDTERFKPADEQSYYAHQCFDIDKSKRIIFFSGHMEHRKGVDIIIKTAIHLTREMARSDLHFLILGNKNGQEKNFSDLYSQTSAENHITFGGYRSDVPDILKSCMLGFIASTGWDSFPMSSIEMAATGLPLVVSDLPGLREAVDSETGCLYPPGDYIKAAELIADLADDDVRRKKMGRLARRRAVSDFSVEQQIAEMEALVRRAAGAMLEEGAGTSAAIR